MINVVAISGYAGHGKDTVCEEILRINPQTVRIALADELKVMCYGMFGWDFLQVRFDARGRIEYPVSGTPEEAAMRRTVHQKMGTEVYRAQDPGYWLKAWSRRAMWNVCTMGAKTILVPDVRFPNEVDFFKHYLCGLSVYVDRGSYRRDGVDYEHESESYNPWIKEQADICLDNTGDVEHLYEQIRREFNV